MEYLASYKVVVPGVGQLAAVGSPFLSRRYNSLALHIQQPVMC